MKPEREAQRVLSITRAKAKMYEFRVPEDEHIKITQHPNKLFSLAIGLLGDAAADLAEKFTDTGVGQELSTTPQLVQEVNWHSGDDNIRDTAPEDLRFAALYFDAFLESRLDVELTTEFSILCASSYDLSGNPGSARVVARRTDRANTSLAGGLALIVHKLILEDYAPTDDIYSYNDLGEELLKSLREYLAGTAEEYPVAQVGQRLRARTYDFGDAAELLYGDIAVALASRKIANSSRRRLPPASDLDFDLWRPALSKNSFPKQLWPAQQRLCDANLLKGQSAVVQMPTSAGKTRAAEIIIRSSFLSNRTSLAVVVAPFRSLCHDIRGDLSHAFANEGVTINEATDTFSAENLDFGAIFDAEAILDELFVPKTILIVTPEKLLYLLRRAPELSDQIGLIIYDEGHQFDGMTRGPTYELLLTSLKIALRPNTQVILISAVIGNADVIANWLLGDAAAVVDSAGLLPTSKSIAFASWQDQRGRLRYVSPSNPDEEEFYVPRAIEAVELEKKSKNAKPKFFPQKYKGSEIGLYLGIQLAGNGSVAVFCGRKDYAANLCEQAVDVFSRTDAFTPPRDFSDAEDLDKIANLIRLNFGDDVIAAKAAEIGILQHHANVPHGLRLAVEHIMKEGRARVVVCTSTLAQGVNFPIKYLLITTVQQGQERIMVRDFHNLIGRAGRAGMHTEGSVIFSNPIVSDSRSSRTDGWKWRAAKGLLDPANSEPCSSGILHMLKDYQQSYPPIMLELPTEILSALVFMSEKELSEVVEASVGRFPNLDRKEFGTYVAHRARAVQSIAAYLLAHEVAGEADDSENARRLVAGTLAFNLATDAEKEKLIRVFDGIARIIVDNKFSLDKKALIRKSPLPPASVMRLEEWLGENLDLLKTFVGNFQALLTYTRPIIINYLTPKNVSVFSDGDVVPLSFDMWLSGASFGEIYKIFTDRKTKIGPRYVRIEDVVALCENVFGFEGSMIAASLADLAETKDVTVHRLFSDLQRRLRYGLLNMAEVAFFEAGFSDRVLASVLAAQFKDVSDRRSVRAICRSQAEKVAGILGDFPSYFSKVHSDIVV